MPANPFFPFQPARGAQFINRQEEIQIVVDRLRQGVNVAVVGNPHIGKTSFLQKLADPATLREAGLEVERFGTIPINFELFSSQHTPEDFWRRVCQRALTSVPDLSRPLKPFVEGSASFQDAYSLSEAFETISAQGGRITLLIDEFDKFLNLPNFARLDFVDPLRAIATTSGGLGLVTASRLSVSELQEQIRSFSPNVFGSPLNFLDTLNLVGFAQSTSTAWLEQCLQPEAVCEAQHLGGGHPLLLHLAGYLLWEEQARPEPRWSAQKEAFVSKAHVHFQDVWNYLSDRAQLTLVLLTLRDLEGRIPGARFDLDQADRNLAWLAAELRELGDRAVLEKDQNDNWVIGSAGFELWLVEKKISPAAYGEMPDVKEFLHDKQFKVASVVTNEDISAIQRILKAIPPNLIDLASKVLISKLSSP